MPNLVGLHSLAFSQVDVDELEALNETGPPIPAMWLDEFIRLFDDDLLHSLNRGDVIRVGVNREGSEVTASDSGPEELRVARSERRGPGVRRLRRMRLFVMFALSQSP